MNRQDFFEIAGYFANPIRNTRIEIEARQSTVNNYNPTYTAATGTQIPIGADSVTVLPDNANKWGREMRIYFTLTNPSTAPNLLSQLMTVGGRPGYQKWNQRLNSKDIIDELFAIGFRLGDPQNTAAIRTFISPIDLQAFNQGFNAQ